MLKWEVTDVSINEYESLEFGSRGLQNLTTLKKLEQNLDSIISREPLHVIWQSFSNACRLV